MVDKRPSVVASGLLARPGAAPARTTPPEDLPKPDAALAVNRDRGGIKAATIGTTLYLLPKEHKRVRQLALDLDVPSVHELLLMGLDHLLTERGERGIERYSQPRPKKGG
jgi:hypothetical protein